MSITYNITTNFGAKDSLPTNDPDKVIVGAEFTTEFNAIKTAFSLAAPAADPTFTGTATFADVDATGTVTVNTELDATLVTANTADVGVGGLTVLGDTTLTGDLAVDTNTFVVDSTNNYVGIGTSSPAKDLDVDGEFRVRNKFTDYLNISSTGVLTGYSDSWTLTGSSTTTNPTFTVSSIHSTNKAPKVVVDGLSDGTLGNSSGATGGTYVSDSQGGTILMGRNDTITMYRSGGSPVVPDFKLDASGNVGIGNTNPAYSLHIGDGTSTEILAIQGAENSHIFFGDADDLDAGRITYAHSIDAYLFTNNGNQERMRIDSSGNLLVGKTAKQTQTAGVDIQQLTATDGDGALGLRAGSNSTTGNAFINCFLQNGTGSGKIEANGANALGFASFSDRALKENITDLPPQLANVLSLRPVEFDYIDGTGHQIGFIAQEVEQVWPDLVSGEEGSKSLVGLGKTESRLIKAIQELSAQVDTLKAELAALKGA